MDTLGRRSPLASRAGFLAVMLSEVRSSCPGTVHAFHHWQALQVRHLLAPWLRRSARAIDDAPPAGTSSPGLSNGSQKVSSASLIVTTGTQRGSRLCGVLGRIAPVHMLKPCAPRGSWQAWPDDGGYFWYGIREEQEGPPGARMLACCSLLSRSRLCSLLFPPWIQSRSETV
jgi:hypothetical protein